MHKVKTSFENFMNKVSIPKDESKCWIWNGYRKSGGYGRIRFIDKNYLAHRVSYMLFSGELHPPLHLHHKCENPPCVNPSHLLEVTNRENTVLLSNKGPGAKLRQTHCKRGHKFTLDNTYKINNGKGRNCKKCCLWLAKRNYERRKLASIN